MTFYINHCWSVYLFSLSRLMEHTLVRICRLGFHSLMASKQVAHRYQLQQRDRSPQQQCVYRQFLHRPVRAVARTLIGGGGVYSYIQVLPDWLLLKSTLFQKKLVGHNLNIWIYTPPINALATALRPVPPFKVVSKLM